VPDKAKGYPGEENVTSDTAAIVALARPHQYVKNLFVLAPLFFVGRITDPDLLLPSMLACAAFSFTASSIYILNDYRDIEEDRKHEHKKHRPLASGRVSVRLALVLMVIFALCGLSLMATLSPPALLVAAAYVLLNVGYSFGLKHFSILDVNIIAIGFVLRLYVGSTVTGVPLSMWIVIMTYLLALFLAIAKRRDDIVRYLASNRKSRRVIDGYNLELLNGAMMIMASVIIVAYILYTTSESVMQRVQNENLYFTVFFVILGLLRYLQIALVENRSGSPTRILYRDIFLQVTLLGWLVSFVWILYV
jgi:decaprenyl-phosphate phosphoribosyltransferase